MRPLSDSTPKPLLTAAGKPLIVWQLERLVAAGFNDIVINVAHRGETPHRYGQRVAQPRTQSVYDPADHQHADRAQAEDRSVGTQVTE